MAFAPTPTPTAPPLSTLLQASTSSSTSHQPWNGAELLKSLHRLGVAHDLQESDLTLPDLSSQAQSSSSSSSMSMLLSRLSLLLSDLGRLQETQIRAHLPALLQSASNVQSLESQVRDVRRGLDDLEVGVERLSRPTRTSLARLQRDQERFKRLNAVQDLLRQASQYVHVARRLETHLQVLFDEEDDRQDAQVEQAMVDSAHCLESLTTATTPPLSSLQFIQSYTPSIQSARAQVIDKMETCIVTGLRDLSPSLLSSSLQTADILGVLSDLVSDLLHDLTDVVRRCVVRAVGVVADHRREWDVALSEQQQDGGAHASSSSPTPYRSKRAQTRNHATTSSPVTALQDSFCQQLHTLMTVEMTAVCSKIYLLQRVLGLMSARGGGEEDADNNPRTLLDEGVKILGEPPTLLFWRTLSTSLESNLTRLPSTFLSTPLASVAAQHSRSSEPLHTNTRIHYHPTWHAHLSRVVDFFFEKTAVWTSIPARGGDGGGDRAPEEVFVRRSMGLA